MIHFIPFTKSSDNKKMKKLYQQEFPKAEQIPFWLLMRKAKKENVDFYQLKDENKWIGLLYIVQYQDIVFIFYFAIYRSLQGQGFGGKVMQEITKRFQGKRIVLNIEEVSETAKNYEQRFKRKQFYERYGFHESGFMVREINVWYEILIHGEKKLTGEDYQKLIASFLGKALYPFFKPKLARKGG